MLIDGPGAKIVKLTVKRDEPFHEMPMLQFPGEDAAALPATSIDHQKHQVPAEATGFQLPDWYAAPPGEYQVADGTSPAFAPVTLNQIHTF